MWQFFRAKLTSSGQSSSTPNTPVKQRRAEGSRMVSHRSTGDFSLNPTGDGKTTLTDRQIRLIQSGWAHRSTDVGGTVVRSLFTRHPDLQLTFGLGEGMDDRQLLRHPLFLRHSAVFTDLLEMIVASLDALDDCLGPLLVSYGHKHVDFESRPNPFRPEFWEYFGGAMCDLQDSWPIRKNRAELKLAWRILVFFVVQKVREGYEAEKKRRGQLLSSPNPKKIDEKIRS